MSHPIESLMQNAINKLREVADANTVVGKEINFSNGVSIIPISKVSIGLGLGGSDLPNKSQKELFGAGTGAGVSVTPIAFLVVKGDGVEILQMCDSDNTANKVVDLVPKMFDKVTTLVKDKKSKDKNEEKID